MADGANTLDDRGQRWRVRGAVYDRAVRGAGHDPRALLRGPGIDAPAGGTAILAIVLAGVAYAALLAATWGRLPVVAYWLLSFPFVALAIAFDQVLARVGTTSARRAGSLDLGLCPSCGYGLREIEAEEDGCRECPECGAAWRLEPPGAVEGS